MEIHEQDGPILLLAGPGTGKTYRIAQRIKFLTENKLIDRDKITVITFTTAAARNMRERISDASKPDIYTPTEKQPRLICTMHSLGLKIVSENAAYFGYRDSIKVLNSDPARNTLIEDSAQTCGFERHDAKETIGCRQNGNCIESAERKCKICRRYRRILRACSYIDYDEQILLANRVLWDRPDIRKTYQDKCVHLLIDEYQDINPGQFELITLLVRDQENGLFAVGDDDQSIYSWRGGSPKYIREFRKYFGEGAQVFPLLKSFRCPEFLLESAFSVVREHDKGRLDKGEFEYINKADGKINIHNVASDQKEADVVRSIITKSLPSKKVLILIPGRRFGTFLIDELKNARINFNAPLNLPGEGLPLINTLSSWLLDNKDSIALRQILTSLIENKESGVPSAKSRKPEALSLRHDALKAISNLWINITNETVSNLWDSLSVDKDKSELLQWLYNTLSSTKGLYDDQENPSEFLSHITRSLRIWKNTKDFVDEIAAWIDVANYLSNQNNEPGVEIMTLQGAKGLEADVVCLLGMENGALPRDKEDHEKIPEESRLMLVSITRAKEELHIFHARKRSGSVMYSKTFDSGKATFEKSLFIDDLPKKYCINVFHK